MEQERWARLVGGAREKWRALPSDSPTRGAVPVGWFDELLAGDLPQGNDAPPMLLHLYRCDDAQLQAFDSDYEAIATAMAPGASHADVLKYGRNASEDDARQWFAGLLEVAVQGHVLRSLGQDRVELGPVLPNGRCADVALMVGDRRIWVEISALSDSNGTIKAFDKTKSVQSLTGDPYLDARRVYRKVFDKVLGPASKLGPQVHPTDPSIVLIGDAAWRSDGAGGLGYCWALDQVVNPAVRADTSPASLLTWLDHDYPDQAAEALESLTSLSAVAVVGYSFDLLELRANGGVDAAHRLEPDELDALRRLLAPRPSWRQS